MCDSHEFSQFQRNLKAFHDQKSSSLLCWRNSATSESTPPPHVLKLLEKGRMKRRKRRRSKKRKEGRFAWIWSVEERGFGVKLGKALPPSCFLLPHTHAHTFWALVRCGYVVGLSGLLTGFPPFIIAGSLVLLLGGTAALGTVSPTSCNDGSLYMATEGGDKERKERRGKSC